MAENHEAHHNINNAASLKAEMRKIGGQSATQDDAKYDNDAPMHEKTSVNGAKSAAATIPDYVPEKELSLREKRKASARAAADAMVLTKKRKSEKKADVEAEYEDSWICCLCKEAECMMQPEAEQLLICDGVCRRLFHYPCAGLQELPKENESYICEDCTKRRHLCSLCQEYGEDDLDVFRCSKEACGLFFHEACLRLHNVDIRIIPSVDGDAKTTSGSNEGASPDGDRSGDAVFDLPEDGDPGKFYATAKREFICPSHTCWTCTQTDLLLKDKQDQERIAASNPKRKRGRGKKGKAKLPSVYQCKTDARLFRCMEQCAMSYHLTCIPPTARVHELAVLCHLHAPTCKMPQLDDRTSLQGSIEKAINKKFDSDEAKRQRTRKKLSSSVASNTFFAGLVGDKNTKKEKSWKKEIRAYEEFPGSEDMWFCLPCDVRDEVHSKPPSYRHVHSLLYQPKSRPTKIQRTPGEVCECKTVCGDDCFNRLLYTECVGTASQNGTSSNCRLGPGCGNRQLQQRQLPKCKPTREQGRGWGLVTLEDVPKGNLVQEYTGEVIDEATKEKRLVAWEKEHPNDPNFYIMSLSPGWFIDARLVSNFARFINHSCRPNCALIPINVNGYMRNGIFAKRDIKAGEYLSYDYHFDTQQGDRFTCRCGAPNCRGTMKCDRPPSTDARSPKKDPEMDNLAGPSKKATKTNLWEEAKARYERDKKFLADFYDKEEKRRSQVDAIVPSGEKNEQVVSGAQERYKILARRNRIFLWRNAIRGSNFAARLARLQAKETKKSSAVSSNTC